MGPQEKRMRQKGVGHQNYGRGFCIHKFEDTKYRLGNAQLGGSGSLFPYNSAVFTGVNHLFKGPAHVLQH